MFCALSIYVKYDKTNILLHNCRLSRTPGRLSKLGYLAANDFTRHERDGVH